MYQIFLLNFSFSCSSCRWMFMVSIQQILKLNVCHSLFVSFKEHFLNLQWQLLPIPILDVELRSLLVISRGLTCYRPQRSCGQGNIITPVCHSVHRGVSASVHAGIPHPSRADTPPEQTPLPRAHTPGSRPPRADTPREADSGIWSMSGRYASYWNAFLLNKISLLLHITIVPISFNLQNIFCDLNCLPYLIPLVFI